MLLTAIQPKPNLAVDAGARAIAFAQTSHPWNFPSS
jgi:hypothetical protein